MPGQFCAKIIVKIRFTHKLVPAAKFAGYGKAGY